MYGIDLYMYFCFIDFMVCFTDSVLFLSPYIGYSHDNANTYMYIQSTLVISTSVISSNRLSRGENLIPVLT